MSEEAKILADAMNYGTGIRMGDRRVDPAEFFRDFSEEMTFVEEVKAAAKAYRDDVRFKALLDSMVHEARTAHGPIDPDYAERDAHEIASSAVALILARIYTRDSELAAMKAERDRYRTLAETALRLAPPSLVIPKPQR